MNVELNENEFDYLCSRCDFGTDSIREFQKHHCQEEPETVELEETYIPRRHRRNGVSIASLGGIVGMAVSAVIVFSVAVPLIKSVADGVTGNTTLSGFENTILMVLPIFVILGLVVASASMFGMM